MSAAAAGQAGHGAPSRGAVGQGTAPGGRPGAPGEWAGSGAPRRAAGGPAGGERSWAPARGLGEEVCGQPAWPCWRVARVLVALGSSLFCPVAVGTSADVVACFEALREAIRENVFCVCVCALVTLCLPLGVS